MSDNDNDTATDPDQLDPNALPPHIYHRTVGPGLEVVADIAAKRGHKYLFDDMPAMLALVDIVTRLADSYQTFHPDTAADHQAVLDGSATAACVMVFQEARLDAETTRQLLGALEAAYARLQQDDVIEGGARFSAMAASYLDRDDREPAKHCLKQAAQHVIAAIEAWQDTKH